MIGLKRRKIDDKKNWWPKEKWKCNENVFELWDNFLREKKNIFMKTKWRLKMKILKLIKKISWGFVISFRMINYGKLRDIFKHDHGIEMKNFFNRIV